MLLIFVGDLEVRRHRRREVGHEDVLAERRVAIHQGSASCVQLVDLGFELNLVEGHACARVLWIVKLAQAERVQDERPATDGGHREQQAVRWAGDVVTERGRRQAHAEHRDTSSTTTTSPQQQQQRWPCHY